MMWQSCITCCTFAFLFMGKIEGNDKKCIEDRDNFLKTLESGVFVINKAKNMVPDCDEIWDEGETCDWNTKKSTTYLEATLKLIEGAKESYPKCSPKVKSLPADCVALLRKGYRTSGIYTIRPKNPIIGDKSIDVYCDMTTDGGTWIVIQRRGKYPVQEDFNRDWQSYKEGFGNMSQEFWLGNDNIYALTNAGLGKISIRFDFADEKGEKKYAVYDNFWIEDEYHNYKLHIDRFHGSAGDSMGYSNNSYFSTKDRRNDERPQEQESCAVYLNSGWWYKNCAYCNPNGLYRPGKTGDIHMYWDSWKGFIGLAFSEIKIRSSRTMDEP